MLYPQINKYRQIFDLSGFWDLKFDENDEGLMSNWKDNLTKTVSIAVPANWNDLFADL
jgi:beta-galactosidase/beta-glucuronidase